MITKDPVKPSVAKKDQHNSGVMLPRLVGAICAIACFVAILRLPIGYYTFLRTIISLGALVFIYSWIKQKNYALTVVFILILILFNPLFPIYLHRKSIWIPLDIITGLLFLIIAFYKKSEPAKQEEKAAEILPVQKTYSRDRIVSAKREIQ
ncbi:DUF6804 family protein [Pedobacter roseus]|nr:DUF6804 family protein [Pedobacter roseus]